MYDVFQAAVGPVEAARALTREDAPGLIFFDSGPSATSEDVSVLMHSPVVFLEGRGQQFVEQPSGSRVSNPVEWLLDQEARMASGGPAWNLPFVGGLAGYLGFEFCRWIDEVRAELAPSRAPDLWVGAFECAAVFRHRDRSWHVVGDDGEAREMLCRAVSRKPTLNERHDIKSAHCATKSVVKPTVTSKIYEEGVDACVEAIYQGELFEINYAERFEADWSAGAWELYQRLRSTSTARFGGFLDTGEAQLLSVSPEQFIQIDQGDVVTRPIKGTRARGADAEHDEQLARELLQSPKDRAENVMIVDLMRNDLTRFCELGSVKASRLCELESFAGVHHLVSTVEGRLARGVTPMEALLSAFPAGSITGAPKLRAIELIAALEHTCRGPYTGSLFYASRDGRLNSNVLIRTATLHEGLARYGAGGAVVAQSSAREERREARLKAEPFYKAIETS